MTAPERSDIPPPLKTDIERVSLAVKAYLYGLSFIVKDTARDSAFVSSHLLAPLSQDLLQSTMALPMLVTEGMWSVARRELRYILEASIKQAVVQQARYNESIPTKLNEFKALLNSPSISCKNRLEINLIPIEKRTLFLEELGKLYGAASDYVHLTEKQVRAIIAAVAEGHTAGFESPQESAAASLLIAKTLAASLVLLFHSVPSYVAGDFFVSPDGESPKWFFERSTYLAEIDSYFDYKHERKLAIAQIVEDRKAKVEF
ncbi:MAG: hypothetical protein V4627_21210 [Pseudomonadota bacterium]